NETEEDIRIRAIALALQHDQRRTRNAILLLEELRKRQTQQTPDSEDEFLLAKLYYSVGDWPKARDILASLTGIEDENPYHLGQFAYYLIKHGELGEAERIVTGLDKTQHGTMQTVELQARILAAKGEKNEASEILKKQAEKPNAPILLIARLVEELGPKGAAEPLYRRIADDYKKPETQLWLARYIGRLDNRTSEALEICEKLWGSVPADLVGGAAVEILYSARPAQKTHIQQVIGRLDKALHKVDEALQKEPKPPNLLSYKAALLNLKAALLNLEEDYEGAISCYRELIKANPKDFLAKNNKAYLLSAINKQHDEALKDLHEAEYAFGRRPTLLDTQAQVFIAKEDPKAAIPLLEEVIEQDPRGSYY